MTIVHLVKIRRCSILKRSKAKIVILVVLVVMILALIMIGDKLFNRISYPSNWELSSTFQVEGKTFIGEDSRMGILSTPLIAGKQVGVHWYLWGEERKLVKASFRLTAEKQGSPPVTLADNQAVAYGDNVADAQVPTLITIPKAGIWRFNVYLDNAYFGSVTVDVQEASTIS